MEIFLKNRNNSSFFKEDFDVLLRRINKSHNNRLYLVDFKAALSPKSTINKLTLIDYKSTFTTVSPQVLNYNSNKEQIIPARLDEQDQQISPNIIGNNNNNTKAQQSELVESQPFYKNSMSIYQKKTSSLDKFIRTDMPKIEYGYANERDNFTWKIPNGSRNKTYSASPNVKINDFLFNYHDRQDRLTQISNSISKKVPNQRKTRNIEISNEAYNSSIFREKPKNFSSAQNFHRNDDLSSKLYDYDSIKKSSNINDRILLSYNRSDIRQNPLHFQSMDLDNKYQSSGFPYHNKILDNTNYHLNHNSNGKYLLNEPNTLENTFSHLLSYNRNNRQNKFSSYAKKSDEKSNFLRYNNDPFKNNEHKSYLKNYYYAPRNQYYHQEKPNSQSIHEELNKQVKERKERLAKSSCTYNSKFLPFKALNQSLDNEPFFMNDKSKSINYYVDDPNLASYHKTNMNRKEDLEVKYKIRPEYARWNHQDTMKNRIKQNGMSDSYIKIDDAKIEEDENFQPKEYEFVNKQYGKIWENSTKI